MDAIERGALNARIVLVASNRANAAGLRTARLAGLPTVAIQPHAFASREDFDRALGARIDAEQPDWVALAGYMRLLSSAFVQRFAGRLVNIHPSLLPHYKGLHTHERVLAAGEHRHGASVHFVTDALDAGPVIRQGSIAVAADDTPTRLADRLMQRVEQRIYPAALAELAAGRVRWHDGRVWRDDRPQEQCPHEDHDTDETP